MKILFVNHKFTAMGGGEVMTIAQAELFKEWGHEVAFYATDAQPYFIENYEYAKFFPYINTGVSNYLKHPIKYYYNKDSLSGLEKIISEFKPDIVHLQYIDTFTYSIFKALKNIPTVMTIHSGYSVFCPIGTFIKHNEFCKTPCLKGNYFNCIKYNCAKNIEKSIRRSFLAYISNKNFKNVDYFITPSEALKRQVLKSDIGIKENQIITIPNFLNSDEINIVPNYKNKGCFLFAGRLVKHKGIQFILQAAKDLPREIEFHIIGSGPYENELKEYAQKNNLDNVKFLGFMDREQIKQEYQNCIATIVSSNWFEIFGLVNIESFINGKPVIASEIGGIPEIVEHDVNGLLFKPANVEKLKECILKYWNNPDLVIEHGQNGYKKAKENYTEEKYYEEIMKIYTKVLNKYKGNNNE